MKKSKLLLIVITLMLSINAFTQSDDGFRQALEHVEKQLQLKIALEQSSKISPAAQKLNDELKNSVSSDVTGEPTIEEKAINIDI